MTDNPHLNVLIQLAKIDGETDGSELELIRQIGASQNVSDEDIDRVLQDAEKMGALPPLEHWTQEEKVELMIDLVLVMKIDGKIDKEEMDFGLKVTRKLGYNDDVLIQLVSQIDEYSQEPVTRELIKERVLSYQDH